MGRLTRDHLSGAPDRRRTRSRRSSVVDRGREPAELPRPRDATLADRRRGSSSRAVEPVALARLADHGVLGGATRDDRSRVPGGERLPGSSPTWLVAPIVTIVAGAARPWRRLRARSRRSRAPGRGAALLWCAPARCASGGEVVGCAGVVVDISDRHLVESNLREQIDRYRRLVDLSPDGIVVHQNGRIVYANRPGSSSSAPTTSNDVLGRSIIDFVHPDSLLETLERIAQALRGLAVSDPAEATLVRLDGTPWVIESVSVLTRGRARTRTR